MSLKKLQAMKAKKGFTLVELIVVIAIIAILAARLIPMLVNHVRASRCSGEIADAKAAHNIASEIVTTRLTDGVPSAQIVADGVPATDLPNHATVLVLAGGGPDDITITATVGDHSYNSGAGVTPCGWERCPGRSS
jgi:type IV pilus assembly protein PilA